MFIIEITKASEVSWNYSCDSKVSFDRVQILTLDILGRRPLFISSFSSSFLFTSPLPISSPSSSFFSPPPLSLPPPFFSSWSFSYLLSFFPLRKFDSVLSSLFGMRLALRILRPYSLIFIVLLFLLFLLALLFFFYLFYFFFFSFSFFSSLSFKEPHIKDSLSLLLKRAPCFFLTSLLFIFLFWS